MRAIKSLIVLILSLGLVASAYGDVQAKKTDKKKQVKQEQKVKKDGQKSGIKKVFSNPFKHHPKSQEADCRKYPNAPGCPNAKQAKQMAKQVDPSKLKTVKQSKSVHKQAFKPAQKSAKKNTKNNAKNNAKNGKAPVKKAQKNAKSKAQAKSQHAQG